MRAREYPSGLAGVAGLHVPDPIPIALRLLAGLRQLGVVSPDDFEARQAELSTRA